jgi:hypothetical protein
MLSLRVLCGRLEVRIRNNASTNYRAPISFLI